MHKIPKQDIVQRIVEHTDFSEEDVEQQIQQKLQALAGLISEEGAAHIVANEHGVNVFLDEPDRPVTLQEIYPGMKSIATYAKVLRKYQLTTFVRNGSEGKVQSLLLGDATTQLRCSVWHDACAYIESVEEGDVIHITQGLSRDNQGRTELSLNDNSTVVRNPQGVTIDVVAAPRLSYPFSYLHTVGETAHVLATIVQVYDVVFFVPRSQRKEGFEYKLEDKHACLINGVLDDGTATMRFVMYTDQVLEVLGTDVEALKDPEQWKIHKQKLHGKLVAADVRKTSNERMQRDELIVQSLQAATPEHVEKIIEKMEDVTLH